MHFAIKEHILASTQRFYFNANRHYLILNLILAVICRLYETYIHEKGSIRFEMEYISEYMMQILCIYLK